MFRLFLIFCTCMLLLPPVSATASDQLAPLESAARQDDQAHSGLNTYEVRVETSKITEMIQQMTASMPADVPRPKPPIITKYWMRGASKSLILAEGNQANPYVDQMVERFSNNLVVELEAMLLPNGYADKRKALTDQATVKSTEVTWAETVLRRFEIHFDQPADLNQAFYRTSIRLPQNGIKTLIFDVDLNSNTITEVNVITADGVHLTTEIRYRQIAGGWLPERIQTTNVTGSIDDLIEVSFTEVDNYLMPSRMTRTLRRPDLQDELDVSFINYKINQPLPESVRIRLQATE